MNKNKRSCSNIPPIGKIECNDKIVNNTVLCVYDIDTKNVFDKLGNYLGQGEFENGILKIIPKTAHP